ncbi:hypothetical protein EV586_10985 [Tumebacillus sp. BK434]|uniref:hypothetical protein n=1 Tax=Tumebacillus sp. BK434 TaxID=2512169 RepID=UPI00104C5D61|nr:hypothetical protein [Tumebacillus sp. BK434]TCP52603.1 hypothetical protein EV586_10985 [Tumebacillus sp. BK434]
MKTFVKLGIAVVVSAGLLVGCAPSDVQTGGSNDVAAKNDQTADKKKEDGSKKFNADVSAEGLGMKVNIAEVKVSPTKIEVGINFQNNNQHAMSWYPDQEAKIVVGDMQLDSNMFMSSGKLGGDIEGGVKKDGVLVFPVADGKKLDVAKVTSLKLKVGKLHSPDFMQKQEIAFDIPVK